MIGALQKQKKRGGGDVGENYQFTKAFDCDRRALCLVKLDLMRGDSSPCDDTRISAGF
jgi:hypothetical protein